MDYLRQTQEKIKNHPKSTIQRLHLHEQVLSKLFQYHLRLMQDGASGSFHQAPHLVGHKDFHPENAENPPQRQHQVHDRFRQPHEKN
jgi:hypothetical protein